MSGIDFAKQAGNAVTSRRSLVRAAAWSVPVVSVAVMAPNAAASTPTEEEPLCQVPDGGGIVSVFRDRIEAVQQGVGKFTLYERHIMVELDAVTERNPHVNLKFLSGPDRGWHFDNYPNGNLNDPSFKQMPTVPQISASGRVLMIQYPGDAIAPTWAQVHPFSVHYVSHMVKCKPDWALVA